MVKMNTEEIQQLANYKSTLDNFIDTWTDKHVRLEFTNGDVIRGHINRIDYQNNPNRDIKLYMITRYRDTALNIRLYWVDNMEEYKQDCPDCLRQEDTTQ